MGERKKDSHDFVISLELCVRKHDEHSGIYSIR